MSAAMGVKEPLDLLPSSLTVTVRRSRTMSSGQIAGSNGSPIVPAMVILALKLLM